MSNDPRQTGQFWTPARERLLLLTLAAIQFTTIVDFVIIMPLGTEFEKVFHITTEQFGSMVGAYALSAGVAGLVAAFVLDRFDRKQALIWVYAGFTVGTLFCAMAPTYHLLVAARYFAGLFGGICGTTVLAIVGDVIPMERRGAAMGKVMSAFSVASIAGVPAGLWIANHSSWHVPFFLIAGLGVIVLTISAIIMPPLRGHLEHIGEEHPVARTWAVIVHPDHMKAYIFMALLTATGFCFFPYIPVYLERNVGLTDDQVPLMYVFGGLFTLYTMNWVGRWADRSGKLRVFMLTSLSAAVPILLVTNLPHVPVAAAIAATTLLMICMSSRMVPAMALMTNAVEPRYRGGFMSINSSVQQFSMGIVSMLGGMIIGKGSHGEMTHFGINGLISIVCAYTCIYLARFLKAPAHTGAPSEPMMVEQL